MYRFEKKSEYKEIQIKNVRHDMISAVFHIRQPSEHIQVSREYGFKVFECTIAEVEKGTS